MALKTNNEQTRNMMRTRSVFAESLFTFARSVVVGFCFRLPGRVYTACLEAFSAPF